MAITVKDADATPTSRELYSLLVNTDQHVIGRVMFGSDDSGTTGRIVMTDSSGRIISVGAAAAGAAVAGNPVAVGGSDGTNVRYVLVDSSGRQVAVGASASGAAVAGNPVIVGGSDGTNARYLRVDSSGNTYFRVAPPSTATHSDVASATTDTTLLSANTSRRGFSIYNDSTAVLYIKYATGASTTSYVTQIAASGYFEDAWGWQGVVHGVWASVNGNARIMELT